MAVVTKKLEKNPVKDLAEEFNIQIIETNILDEAILKKIQDLKPDFFIVEDYGLILPETFLKIPSIAPLNIHHSLLPKYRGPSPAPAAILNADKTSGVSVIKMTAEVDAGDILAQQEYMLSEKETTDTLLKKLNKLGALLAVKVIEQYLKEEVRPIKQDPAKASYTKLFKRDDSYFDLNNPPSPDELDRMIRAYYPWPGVWTKWKGKIVKFFPEEKMQMEGKKILSKTDFLNGYPDFPLKHS